jgi:glutamine amidotransferase
MTTLKRGRVTAAIVDYGLGNLFSVGQACRYAGMDVVTAQHADGLAAADVVILPGVGAFGDAMATLHRLDLVSALRDVAAAGRPLIGICLGIQLLMCESMEFGHHKGLGIIDGDVVRLDDSGATGRPVKIPHVQWNAIHRRRTAANDVDPWHDTPLADVADGEYMYFVHSLYARPSEASLCIAVTRYGDREFCSALQWRNVFACQFHPERSGLAGLAVYRNVATAIRRARGESAA